jgi:hypothetical protein
MGRRKRYPIKILAYYRQITQGLQRYASVLQPDMDCIGVIAASQVVLYCTALLACDASVPAIDQRDLQDLT